MMSAIALTRRLPTSRPPAADIARIAAVALAAVREASQSLLEPGLATKHAWCVAWLARFAPEVIPPKTLEELRQLTNESDTDARRPVQIPTAAAIWAHTPTDELPACVVEHIDDRDPQRRDAAHLALGLLAPELIRTGDELLARLLRLNRRNERQSAPALMALLAGADDDEAKDEIVDRFARSGPGLAACESLEGLLRGKSVENYWFAPRFAQIERDLWLRLAAVLDAPGDQATLALLGGEIDPRRIRRAARDAVFRGSMPRLRMRELERRVRTHPLTGLTLCRERFDEAT